MLKEISNIKIKNKQEDESYSRDIKKNAYQICKESIKMLDSFIFFVLFPFFISLSQWGWQWLLNFLFPFLNTSFNSFLLFPFFALFIFRVSLKPLSNLFKNLLLNKADYKPFYYMNSKTYLINCLDIFFEPIFPTGTAVNCLITWIRVNLFLYFTPSWIALNSRCFLQQFNEVRLQLKGNH